MMGGFSKITKYINIEVIGFVFAICMMSWILFNAVWTPAPRKIKIDCTWAEISPDIPPQAREECRRLRANVTH
jgi:hypothetical protein